jgi:PAS domain S-box-containing protein
MNLIRKTLTGERWEVVEISIQHIDGSVRTVLWNSATIFAPDGKTAVAIIAQGQDITERKRMEEELREREQEIRVITDNVPALVSYIDTDRRYRFVNKRYEDWFGIPRSEIIGNHLHIKEVLGEATYALIKDRIEMVLSGKQLHYEEALPYAYGGMRWVIVDYVPDFDELQRVKGYFALVTDITERKRAEEALLESKEFVENLIASMQDGFSVLDSHGVHIDVNPAFCQMIGFSREELIGVGTSHPYWPPEAYEEIEKAFQKTLRGEFSDVELTFMRKNGERFPVIVSPSWVKDKQGNVTSYFATVKDITERKRVEELLKKSEEEAKRLAQENAIMAEIGRIISSTMNIDEVYERFAEEVHKLISFDRIAINIINLEDHTFTVAYVTGVEITDRRQGDIISLAGTVPEKALLARSGSIIQIADNNKTTSRSPAYLPSFGAGLRSMVAIPLISKDQVIGILHLQSIKPNAYTERELRIAERVGYQIASAVANAQLFAEHKRAEEEYRTILRTAMDGFWIVDMEGRFLDVNDAFCRLIGYSRDEILTMRISDVEAIESPEDTSQRIEKIMKVSGDRFETRHRCKDGRIIDIEVSVNYMAVNGGRMFVFLRDITERKRAELERERLLADLEAKNKELESFVYTISHDLKAPLVSLNGFSSVLQKDYESQLGEEGKHYLERIQANVAHMEVLITSLLELSRIGQVVGPIEEIDVGPLLREIRDALAVRLKEAGAEFVVQEPLPTIRADRGRIHQVFVNLIDNAAKFRSAERVLRIEVGCQQESGFYRFYVADNGIGIAPQYHEQIFTPFRKLHPEIEGVGIGLALVKKIVEHHGGRAWVYSEAGKGATFYFTIPKG